MTTELFTKGYDNQNEDYCKVVELEGRTLVIMADGMGGLSLGAEAAECACEATAEYVSKHLDVENLWQETFKYADNKLRELSLANHSNMGAAVTALIITEASCVVAWQGNVRLYIHRNNELQQITTDHVIDDGYGHKLLTRCLKGSGLRGEVSYSILPLHSGDTLYMCTDGFYNVQEAEIAKGEVLVHDAHCEDNTLQLKLAEMEWPVALGVIRDVDAPTYDDSVGAQIEEVKSQKKYHNFAELLETNDIWEVK